MSIPVDIREHQKAVAAAFANKKPEGEPDRKQKSDAAKEREKRREVMQTLEEAKARIAELEAENDKHKSENSELAQRYADYDTHKADAEKYRAFEHRERQTLLKNVPTELQKEAKEWPLSALKSFAGKLAGNPGTEKFDRSKMSDDDLAKLAVENPEKFNEIMFEKPKA
jgi:hypothetical protein